MSVERTYYCDGPANPSLPNAGEDDRCPTHARTAGRGLPAGFLRVVGFGSPLHFCSWDCVLRYAATHPPVEVVALD